MKKLKLFFACLLMAVLSIGQVWGAIDANSTWTATAFADIPDGATVIMINNFGNSFANATVTKAPAKVAASFNSTTKKITVSTTGKSLDDIAWTVEQATNGTKFWVYGSTTNLLGLSKTNDNNAVAVNTTSNAQYNEFVMGDNGKLLKYYNAGRYVGEYVTGSDWRSYNSENANNYKSGTTEQALTFYVLDDNEGPLTPTCATPTFDPEDGETFTDDIDVEIASATEGVTIYYTTDGNDPTTSSNEYSTALNFTETTTLKAMAVKAGYDNSVVATATYTKVVPFSGSILEIVKGDFTTSSYDDNAGDHEKSGITFTTAKVYQSGGGIQFQKTNGLLYNKTDLGEIAKIEITTVSGKSNNLVVYSGTTENPTSGAVTGSTSGSVTTYTFAAGKGFFAIKCNSTGASNVDPIKIYYTSSASSVAKPTISGDENFVTSTTVTISHADADHIYYTTNGDAPTTSSTEYTEPFTVDADGTTTVKAIAVKGSDVSAVASKDFTKVTPKTTAAALRAFATSSAQNAFIQLDGWKVTFVNGNNAYMIDPSNEGVILNNASHGYVAGDELNDEVVEASVKLASGRVQLSGFTSTDITATSGTVSPVDVTDFSTVLAANQSRLITLKNATYASSTGTFSDGEHLIYFYDQFNANPALVDGATYDVTGVVIYYKNNTTDKVQVAPRTAADVVPTSVIVIPTAANLAALKAAERGTYILTLTNAVVTYVNGKNVFVEEGSTGVLIRLDSHSFEAGNCLNGDYQVTTEDYQGKFEITAIEPQAGAATTTAEIPLTTVSIATLNASFGSYESRRVKIVGADVTDGIGDSDRNGAINDGAALAVYAGVTNTITLTVNDNVDIIGYPGFHNTDEQLTVWRQEDITVNVKEDPELAYNPTVVNVLLSDLASFTPAELEYATGFDGLAAITYESSDPSIATVEADGTVTLVATAEGSTTITASFPGNPTYKVDNASYTINVSATPIAPVYTMSFDLTRASYDAAADAQVVWNSSVVTMTADKNDGTKVTNYLAGNYSGTTLIAETRFYTKNSISFVPQSGVTITKIEWMSTAKGYATKLAAETFVNATAVVDGTDDKLVIITPSAAGEISVTLTDAARATGITVYYTAESEKAKLPASISIDDMNMAVGDDDILLSAIAATSNPNKKAISYAVTSGTAVTIEGTGAEAALHAAAEGSATITATIPDDLGNYTGATTSFMITVAAAATLESIAISGEATELVYTEGQSFNPAGLTVMGHYSNGSDAEITEGIVWAFDPDPLTKGTTSVSVTATVGTVTSSDAVVVDGLTVSGPAPVGDNYVKVTASQTDWSGDYILVYEDGTDAYVWNGDYSDGASNYASATISSNTIAKPAAAAVITIAAASEGKYTLQVNGDKYFQDNGSNAKLIFTDAIADAAEVTISYETDWTKLLFSERCIRFNNTSGQTRFRFYAANNQQAVQLYKKEAPKYSVTYAAGEGSGDAPAAVEYEEGETFTVAAADLFTAPASKEFDKWNDGTNDYAPGATYTVGTADVVLTAYWKDAAPTPTADYTREVTPGNYGTICLPKAGTIEGASIFEIAYYGEASKTIFVDEITSGHMGAGVPYIFQATAAQLKVTYDDKAAVDVAAGEANGLHGFYNLENEEATLPLADDASLGNYILYQNQYWLVSGRPAYINNFRAYIKLSEISPKEPALAPGRRRVAMAVNGENAATGFENIESGDKPMKVMIEGTMYIIRGEKVYDATGRLVK